MGIYGDFQGLYGTCMGIGNNGMGVRNRLEQNNTLSLISQLSLPRLTLSVISLMIFGSLSCHPFWDFMISLLLQIPLHVS